MATEAVMKQFLECYWTKVERNANQKVISLDVLLRYKDSGFVYKQETTIYLNEIRQVYRNGADSGELIQVINIGEPSSGWFIECRIMGRKTIVHCGPSHFFSG